MDDDFATGIEQFMGPDLPKLAPQAAAPQGDDQLAAGFQAFMGDQIGLLQKPGLDDDELKRRKEIQDQLASIASARQNTSQQVASGLGAPQWMGSAANWVGRQLGLSTADDATQQGQAPNEEALKKELDQLNERRLAPYREEAIKNEAESQATAPWSSERLTNPGIQHSYYFRQVGLPIVPEVMFGKAMARFNKGEETEDDLRLIAKRQLADQLDAQRSQREQFAGRVMGIPAQLSALMAGGQAAEGVMGAVGMESAAGTPLLGRAINFAAGTGAQAALTPNLGLQNVIEKNIEAGRDPLDPTGIPAGMTKATIEAAVLQGAGKVWNKVLPATSTAGRYAVAGLTGPISQQITDLTTYGLGLNSRYGRLQDIAEGKYGQAAAGTLLDIFNYGLMPALHGNPDRAKEILNNAVEAINEGAKQGKPAVEALKPALDEAKANADANQKAASGPADPFTHAEMESGGTEMLKDMKASPEFADLAASVPAGSKPIGRPNAAFVFETPDGKIVRIGPAGERANVPEMLQPTDVKQFGKWQVETLPKAERIGDSELFSQNYKPLVAALESQGYRASDLHPDNIGVVDGKVVIIDPGAVRKATPRELELLAKKREAAKPAETSQTPPQAETPQKPPEQPQAEQPESAQIPLQQPESAPGQAESPPEGEIAPPAQSSLIGAPSPKPAKPAEAPPALLGAPKLAEPPKAVRKAPSLNDLVRQQKAEMKSEDSVWAQTERSSVTENPVPYHLSVQFAEAGLTQRESDALSLLLQGNSTRTAGEAIGKSNVTAKTDADKAIAKLKAKYPEDWLGINTAEQWAASQRLQSAATMAERGQLVSQGDLSNVAEGKAQWQGSAKNRSDVVEKLIADEEAAAKEEAELNERIKQHQRELGDALVRQRLAEAREADARAEAEAIRNRQAREQAAGPGVARQAETPLQRLQRIRAARAGAPAQGPEGAPEGNAESPPASPGNPAADNDVKPFGAPVTEAERSVLPGGGQSDDAMAEARKRDTALANAQVDAERQARGLPPLMKQAREGDQEVWDKAMQMLDANPEAGKQLVDELLAKPRPLSPEETMLLLHRKIALQNEHERAILDLLRASADIRNGKSSADAIDMDALTKREEEIGKQVNDVDKVSSAYGSETGRAFRLRRLLMAEDYSISGMLRRAEAAKGEPLTEQEKSQIVELQAKIADLQAKLKKAEDAMADVKVQTEGKTPAEAAKVVADSNQLQDLVSAQEEEAKVRDDFTGQLDDFRWIRKPTTQKIADLFLRLRQAAVISSPKTMAKIVLASLEQIGIAPAREAIGGVYSRIPGLSMIARRAPREGAGFSFSRERAAIGSAIMKGFADSWQTVRQGGQSNLDIMYGGRQRGDGGLLGKIIDFTGVLHAAAKAPAVRAEYTRSFLSRLTQLHAQGYDITNPLLLTKTGIEAYKDSQVAKFQGDNQVVEAYRGFVKKLRTSESPSANALGYGLEVALPVVKVPTNIVAEMSEHVFGTVTGSWRAARAFRDGVNTLTPQQADTIMRQLKRGSLGAALLALGYFSPKSIGGFYQPDDKRDKNKTGFGEIDTPIGTVPSWALHNPALEVLQLGATVRQVQDSLTRKRGGEPKGLGEGVIAGALGMAEEVPFVRETADIGKLYDPQQRGSFLGEYAKSLAIPQLVSWLAGRMDTGSNGLFGEPVKRKPKTTLEHLETGIPGLRQNVPSEQDRKMMLKNQKVLRK